MERMDASLDTLRVLQQDGAGRPWGRGNRDIERPENSPVDCFQRDGAGRPWGIGNREQGTGMAAGAVAKAFPSDRRERFRGGVGPGESASVRWADRKAGSVEVGPPAVSTVCVLSSRRPTSSDLADGSKLPARPPSPEGEGFWMYPNP